MNPREKILACLQQKQRILAALTANTETQGRFIKARKLKGLKRVLQEREQLIQELSAINEMIDSDQNWQTQRDITALRQAIALQQQTVIARSNQVLQQAVSERLCVAAELRKSKIGRQLNRQYVNPWAVMLAGRRINEKG